MLIRIAYFLIFLTGATGLIYQVTWQKYISTLVGSHASATSAVLALFFLFLSLGYSFFGKFSTKILRNQLMLYAALEFFIGLYAIYSPQIFEIIFTGFTGSAIEMGTGDGLFAPLVLGGLFMFFPTFLMGGTIPALTQGLSTSLSLSARTHAIIYGVNTLGAFIGCILGGFLLIEQMGLDGTLLLTGNINVLIGVVAAVLARKSMNGFTGPEESTVSESVPQLRTGSGFILLIISFCSGYYTFALEKLVVRMAGISIGSTVYTYSIIVSAFILAIGAGALMLTLNKKFESPKFYAGVQFSSVVATMVLYLTVSEWPVWFLRLRALVQTHESNFEFYWFLVLFAFIFILILPVGLLGANLPMLFGLLRSRNILLAQTVGRLYTVNCLGAVVGAAVGGYLVFNYFDASQAFRIALAVMLFATLLSMFVVFEGKLRILGTGATAVLVLGFLLLPAWRIQSFVPGLYLLQGQIGARTTLESAVRSYRKGHENILFSQYDPNTQATVIELDDTEKSRALYVNGKPDSHSTHDQETRAMAALIPMSIMPKKIEKAFIVGLGGGLSTAILSGMSELKQLDVAEISEGVVNSLPYFEKYNFNLQERMQKVRIQIGDAYRILMQKDKYDLIVCEPSNPWVSGVDKLFTKEFYEIGAKKLTEGGYYVQWFPFTSVDDPTLLTILKTFRSVFRHVTVFSAYGGALTLVGSNSDFIVDVQSAKVRFDESLHIFEKYGMKSEKDIFLFQILTPFMVDAMVDKVTDIHSLFAPILEFRSSRSYFASVISDVSGLLTQTIPIPLPAAGNVSQFFYEQFDDKSLIEALRRIYDLAGSSLYHHRVRLYLEAQKKFPGHPLFSKESLEYRDYVELLSGRPMDDGRYKKRATRLREIEGLLSKFRMLVALGMRPPLGQVAKLIETDCVQEGCYPEKRLAAGLLGAPAQSAKISQFPYSKASPVEIDFVEKAWADQKTLYKKLGSF